MTSFCDHSRGVQALWVKHYTQCKYFHAADFGIESIMINQTEFQQHRTQHHFSQQTSTAETFLSDIQMTEII